MLCSSMSYLALHCNNADVSITHLHQRKKQQQHYKQTIKLSRSPMRLKMEALCTVFIYPLANGDNNCYSN